MPVSYITPADDNGLSYGGVLVPGAGLYAPQGISTNTDGNGKTYAQTLVFVSGPASAQYPTTDTIPTATDYAVTIPTTPYHRMMMQNNMTGGTILYFAWDHAASTATFQLQPGQFLEFDTGSVLHLFQNSGSSVNLNGASGVTVQAW